MLSYNDKRNNKTTGWLNDRPINQPNRPTNQPNRQINRPTRKLTKPTDQPTNQPTNKPTKPTNQLKTFYELLLLPISAT
jgi:hypothetical protein